MKEKRHILFVDDEPNILSSLRRMLFSMQNQWKMSFANSGKEALKILSEEAFDVIVSDLSMPEMNGFELLTEVKKSYPKIVRIAFSGQIDSDKKLHSLRPIHQYINKPVDKKKVIETIDRACSLHDLLSNIELRKLLSRLDSLPSYPFIYRQLVQELESPNASLNKVSKIIAQDVGMSVKMLQFVNSAFFGLPRQITDQKMAVILLGLDIITSLTLTIHVFQQLQKDKITKFSLENLWQHSQQVSMYAKTITITQGCDKNTSDSAFTSGLLHDIGKLILIDNLPDQYSKAMDISTSERIPVFLAEREVFGTTHAEVGAYLLGLWGLDESVVEAIAYHHQPERCQNGSFSPLTSVHVANIFDHVKAIEKELAVIELCNREYLSELGLTQQLPLWANACQKFEDDEKRKKKE